MAHPKAVMGDIRKDNTSIDTKRLLQHKNLICYNIVLMSIRLTHLISSMVFNREKKKEKKSDILFNFC